jgi:cytochrome c5
MSDARLWMAPAILAVSITAAAAPQSLHREGKVIVEEVCVACHGAGLEGAPRIGDVKAWSQRSARGLSSLTKSAMEGVRKMPPHGGRLDLDDVDLARAITYMVNQSGGRWVEPIDRSRPPARRSGAQIVVSQCSICHETGVGGAPRIGDREAWVGRARDGFESLVVSATRGHGAMPARGGLADLTDPELRSAVEFMFQTSVNGRAMERISVRDIVAHAGEDVVKLRCARCHAEGAGGAPRVGDATAWARRSGGSKGGIDGLVGSAIHGHGGMPSRGGTGGLTDEEMRAAVAYMMQPAGVASH